MPPAVDPPLLFSSPGLCASTGPPAASASAERLQRGDAPHRRHLVRLCRPGADLAMEPKRPQSRRNRVRGTVNNFECYLFFVPRSPF